MWPVRLWAKNMLTVQNTIQVTWCYIFFPLLTSSGIPRFWMNPCQTGLVRSHHRPSTLLQNPSHSSQRSPPHPFWALRISCAKLLICLVTSQCFLHGTEGEISTLPCAVNHSALPLVHWYDHYSIRLHSNWPQFLVITIRCWGLFSHHFIFLNVFLLLTVFVFIDQWQTYNNVGVLTEHLRSEEWY